MALPMLADFAIQLAGGLAAVLATTSWRAVPPAFFRTHCQVILGLGVLATLVISRPPMNPTVFGLSLAVAGLAFVATVVWGLGLPRIALPVTVLVAVLSGIAVVLTTDGPTPGVRVLNAFSRLTSAFLLGSTLTAMLLGHHYLTAPAMSIEPLKQFVRFMGWGLLIRTVLAGSVAGIWWSYRGHSAAGMGIEPLFLAMRWGMGIIGMAVGTYLTWRTVLIRSTQSATGILYIAMTLLLFGELTSMVLARDSHLVI